MLHLFFNYFYFSYFLNCFQYQFYVIILYHHLILYNIVAFTQLKLPVFQLKFKCGLFSLHPFNYFEYNPSVLSIRSENFISENLTGLDFQLFEEITEMIYDYFS